MLEAAWVMFNYRYSARVLILLGYSHFQEVL